MGSMKSLLVRWRQYVGLAYKVYRDVKVRDVRDFRDVKVYRDVMMLWQKMAKMLNSMFQKNGIKFLNYTVFSLNYFIKMGNDESNNSQTHVR